MALNEEQRRLLNEYQWAEFAYDEAQKKGAPLAEAERRLMDASRAIDAYAATTRPTPPLRPRPWFLTPLRAFAGLPGLRLGLLLAAMVSLSAWLLLTR